MSIAIRLSAQFIGGLASCWASGALAVPAAEDDRYATRIDEVLLVEAPGVLANDDAGGGPLNAELISVPDQGGTIILLGDGAFQYTPPPGFAGEDVFTYRVRQDGVAGNIAEVAIDVTDAAADVTVYLDYQEFVAAIDAFGLQRLRESFEDDDPWGAVRTTIAGGEHTAPSISNLGLTWAANNADGEVTTGDGPAFVGDWGFFTLPHGNYLTGTDCDVPGNCGDGWRVRSEQPLHALGGFVKTGTPFAKLGIFLGPGLEVPVDLGETCDPDGQNCVSNATLDTGFQFFGVLVPAGVREFEFRELEGKAEDQKFIFADEFAFGVAAGLDSDGDGIVDTQDNCTLVPNADQRNTDGDRYGNLCDPDFDQDDFVGRSDFLYFRARLQTADPDADLNGDGVVNLGDFRLLRPYVGGPPGPSGLP